MKMMVFYIFIFLLLGTYAFAGGQFINGQWVTQDLGILTQSDNYGELIAATCYNGSGNGTCSCYTTTTSTKVGAIKIKINGVFRWIDFKNGPN